MTRDDHPGAGSPALTALFKQLDDVVNRIECRMIGHGQSDPALEQEYEAIKQQIALVAAQASAQVETLSQKLAAAEARCSILEAQLAEPSDQVKAIRRGRDSGGHWPGSDF